VVCLSRLVVRAGCSSIATRWSGVCELSVNMWSGMRRWPVFGGSTRRTHGYTSASASRGRRPRLGGRTQMGTSGSPWGPAPGQEKTKPRPENSRKARSRRSRKSAPFAGKSDPAANDSKGRDGLRNRRSGVRISPGAWSPLRPMNRCSCCLRRPGLRISDVIALRWCGLDSTRARRLAAPHVRFAAGRAGRPGSFGLHRWRCGPPSIPVGTDEFLAGSAERPGWA
jgi:hypothetical protein